MKTTALSLGGNAGNTAENLDRAVRMLNDGGFQVLAVSRKYRTAPVDCAPGTPDFLNTALTGLWKDSPEALLDLTQSIEVKLGRPAEHGYHTDRTMDIDIIVCNDVKVNTPRLTLPHPEAAKRRFVLEPLAEIAPELVIGEKTVREWLERIGN